MLAGHGNIRALTNIGVTMSKNKRTYIRCPKCLKERLVFKWIAGDLCKSCSNKLNGAKRKGIALVRRIDLTGQKLRDLTVIKPTHNIYGKAGWLCLCKCGKELVITTSRLTKDKQRSCGCHKVTQGGNSGSRTYKSWDCMIRRCTLKSSNRWHIYGGRGITVCDRWKESFLSFLEDMGERPENTSLDRIDNDKGYFKENCRWATSREQANNRRVSCPITAFGKTQNSREWSEEVGIKRATIEFRLKKGLSAEEALTKKVKNG